MTAIAVEVRVFTCDRCRHPAETKADEPLPYGWFQILWPEADPRGASLGGEPYQILVQKHFDKADCMAWWIMEHGQLTARHPHNGKMITVAYQDVMGWSSQHATRLWGCPSCGTRDEHHLVGCTIHR